MTSIIKEEADKLIDDVAQSRTDRIVLTKHNSPVAETIPINKKSLELWGAMRGTVAVSPGVDLTADTGEIWDADS